MAVDIAARIAADRVRVETVLATLRREAGKWGVNLDRLHCDAGSYEFQRDPSSGELALRGRWTLASRRAEITLRADGNAWAECDLLVDHPQKPGWWIEAVTAWGVLPELKSEPRLLAKPA